MNEKPKSIWKKSWQGLHWLRAWVMVVAATCFTVLIVTLLISGGPRNFSDWWPTLVFTLVVSVVVATVFVGLWAFLRWLCSWHNFCRFLFGLACFITLIALFYAEEDWRGWHAWNKFKHEWEAKGEHFDFASMVPPPVPNDQNFALTPVVASSYETMLDKSGQEINPRNTNVVDRLSMITWRDNHWKHVPKSDGWLVGKKADLVSWQDYFRSPPPNSVETNSFPVAPRPQSPADDILLALSKYDSAIEEFRQAAQLPYSRFPLTYDKDNPAGIMLPHLSAVKSCALALNLRALAGLQNGRSETAWADVKLSLRLADSIHTEPFLISQLVRIAIVQAALQPVWEGLAEHRWSAEQLMTFDAELAKLDFVADYRLSMRGEMGHQGGIFDYLRQNPAQLKNLSGDFGGPNPPLPGRIVSRLIPTGWFYQNQLHCARMMVKYILPLVDVNRRIVSPEAVRRFGDAVGKETKRLTPYNMFERLLLPALGNAARRFAYGQASVDLVCTAIALERYRLAHGGYPESLDALAPQFIAKLPHDIINGQPLHYRRTDDGQFVLYSVGWNETDDGGEVALDGPFGKSGNVNINKGDWVWRYPAK